MSRNHFITLEKAYSEIIENIETFKSNLIKDTVKNKVNKNIRYA